MCVSRQSLLLLAILLPPLTAFAQPAKPPKFARAEIGFDGIYKVGYWTPVTLTIAGGSENLTGVIEVVVPDGDGLPSRVVGPPLAVLPGRSTTRTLYVKFGRDLAAMTARFIVEGRVRAQRRWGQGYVDENPGRNIPAAQDATADLYVVVGGSVGVAEALRSSERDVHVARINDPAQLPSRWYGYDGVDAVVLLTSKTGLYDAFAAQAESLDRWVQLGGRLLLVAGGNAPDLIASGGPLARFSPGTYESMAELRQTAALEAYSQVQQPVRTGGAIALAMPRFSELDGRILAPEGVRTGELPIVIRSAHGFGTVTFVSVDIDRPPFVDWEGRPSLVARLLDAEARSGAQDESLLALSQVGYGDLVGQLRQTLFEFEGVRFVPFSLVALLVVVYILIIGPFDYWLVRHVLRRPQATWVTFPVYVIVISGLAYFAAYQFKGRQLRTNMVELVDIDAASGLVRGSAWANIFSPRPESYDLSLDPALPDAIETNAPPSLLFSWLDFPGAAMGGVEAGGGALGGASYGFAPSLDAMHGVPIQVWSTKSVTGRWQAQGDVPIEAHLSASRAGVLDGTIVQRLGLDIKDARLLYDRWAYSIPELKDGQLVKLEEQARPVLSETLLTRQKKAESSQINTAYDWDGGDVDAIVEMMMFHQAAGGSQYTEGLANDYQSYIDLTSHLSLDRAILYARLDGDGSELTRDGHPLRGEGDRRWRYLRIVLPVERQ